MKIKKSELEIIIKEEIQSMLDEAPANISSYTISAEKYNLFKTEMEKIGMFLDDAYDRAYHDLQASNTYGAQTASKFFEENPNGVLMAITPESAKELRRSLAGIHSALGRLLPAYGMELKSMRDEKYKANQQFNLKSLNREE